MAAMADLMPNTNQAELADAIDALVALLELPADDGDRSTPLPDCPSLAGLAAMFGLSAFEQALVLLCAGIELDARVARACAAATGDETRAYPTFALALATLPEPHWSALGPESPLRRWHLIELAMTPGLPLTAQPLAIDERVLHHLMGLRQPASQLRGLTAPIPPPEGMVPSHEALAARIAHAWSRATEAPPIVILSGHDAGAKRSIAATAAAALGLGLISLAPEAIPTAPADRATLARFCERESALSNVALFVDATDLDGDLFPVARFIDESATSTFVAVRETLPGLRRPAMTLSVSRPAAAEQRALWRQHLGDAAALLNGQVEHIASQFDLSDADIRAAVTQATFAEGGDIGTALWDAGRAQARVRLDDLAERIESSATWDDLVLPAESRSALHELAAQVRHRSTVYETWGFAAVGKRGLGISALFAGPSGTGKTLAAEVLAHELRLDLYRVDLSGIVSKYIGETEKNLRRIFDAAELGGAVLFFDEADALFGKRSEVKDSHDRYANIEVNYLLQRMESYRGIAILATNAKGALDPAFLRRIRFVVTFPFPDAEHRVEIWRRVFPAGAPTAGLDPERLARLDLTGGNIRSIAVNAAFLAAAADQPIGPRHIMRAARNEYVKLERPLPENELPGAPLEGVTP
jgi:hypothetical protein